MTTASPKLYDLLDEPSLAGAHDAWRAPWEQIADTTTLLGVRMGDDRWVFPDHAFRPFLSQSAKQIDFTQALPKDWERGEPRSEEVLRRLKRTAHLYATSSRDSRRGAHHTKGTHVRRALSMTTVVDSAKALLKTTRFLLETGRTSAVVDDCPDGTAVFSTQTPKDREAIETAGGKFLNEAHARLAAMVEDGIITDWLTFPLSTKAAPNPLQNATNPLDDALFAQVLEASLFWSQACEDVVALYQELTSLNTPINDTRKQQAMLRQALADFQGTTLTAGVDFPYGIALDHTTVYNLGQVHKPMRFMRKLMFLCQSSNAFLLATATGMRPSELDTLPRDPLHTTAQGTVLAGLAFKGQDAFAGQDRDWPLPERAVQAVHRQMAMANALDPNGSFLWFSPPIGNSASKGQAVSVQISPSFAYLSYPNGETLCGRNDLSVYRVRTSVARLMALSVQGGPLALLTVYGHKDIHETMGYYRARGDFEQELSETISTVSKALGETILTEHMAGVLPSRTAQMVATTLDGLGVSPTLPKDGLDVFGTPVLLEAAEILGEGAEMVRTGVLCTARSTGQGLCVTRSGARDAANCSTACPYRFELSAALDDRKRIADNHLAQLADLPSQEMFRLHFARTGLLTAIQGFEGPLAPYQTDARVLDALRPLLATPQAVPAAMASTLLALFGAST